ncbi:MAG: CidA/LrgA family protein [Lachnospiraceae bacterium]|nr:CidA/LrgA family protein [Lachnospiraceae bacterium]
MKYIKQLTIIITISLLGEVLSQVLPFSIPASVYGLFLMLAALMTKIIKVEHVKETSDFLMDIMPIMFVPASVGLMVSWGLLKEILIPALIVSILGTLIVMVVSGKTVDGIMRLVSKDTVMTDGITVDGIDVTSDDMGGAE